MLKDIQKQVNSPDSFVSMILGLAVVLIIGIVAFNYFTRGNDNKTAVTGENAQEQTTADESEATTTPAGLPAVYEVKAGDTLWSISQKFYNSGYNWVDVVKANKLANANDIKVGQKLNIPKTAVITPAADGQVASTSTQKAKTSTYTVKKGDSLWKIAVAQYNNGYRWTDIAKANNLINPNYIHPGNTLKLP